MACRILKNYFPSGKERMDSSSGQVCTAREEVDVPSCLKPGVFSTPLRIRALTILTINSYCLPTLLAKCDFLNVQPWDLVLVSKASMLGDVPCSLRTHYLKSLR